MEDILEKTLLATNGNTYYLDMNGNKTENRIYKGEKLTLATGQRHTIITANPRPIEILFATQDGIPNQDVRVSFESGAEFNRCLHQEKGMDLTPATPLPGNKKFTLLIPQKAPDPVIDLFTGQSSGSSFQFPLSPFIDKENTDPVKLFILQPQANFSPGPIPMEGDASYLKDLSFTPVSDDDDSMLVSQEMASTIDLPDGVVNIEELDDETCEAIANQILGRDYEKQFDESKVPESEREKYRKIVKKSSKTATSVVMVWNHRQILLDFGFEGKFYIKQIHGQQYVIFKGYAGLRKWYTSARYKATNPKVAALSTVGRLKSAAKVNSVTLFIIGATEVVDWMLSEDDEKEVQDMLIGLGMSALKSIISSMLAAGLVSILLGIFTASAPVWLVVGGTIFLGIGFGLAIDYLDNKIGITQYLQDKGREGRSILEAAWYEHITEPMGRMYYQLEKSIESLYLRNVHYGY